MTLGSGRDDTVDLSTKVAYGFGALGKDFACSIIYIFLMFYYTDVADNPACGVRGILIFGSAGCRCRNRPDDGCSG